MRKGHYWENNVAESFVKKKDACNGRNVTIMFDKRSEIFVNLLFD